MHVLFLIAGMAFAEKNIERDFRIAESATAVGGVFAIVSTVSYHRAKKIEDQMLRESNNYNACIHITWDVLYVMHYGLCFSFYKCPFK